MCLAIDASFEVLNPNNFTYFPAAYIDEIKNYYIQNNDRHNWWIFTIWKFWKQQLYWGRRFTKNDYYICGHLISWSPNRSYFECQYNYATKAKIVCRWKRKHGFKACAKKGEAICGDKLENLF